MLVVPSVGGEFFESGGGRHKSCAPSALGADSLLP